MSGRNTNHNPVKRAKAGNMAVLRACAAGYLAYLAWQIVAGVCSGESSMTPAVGYMAAAFFLLAAVAIAVYLIRQWRIEAEAARLPESDAAEDTAEEET